MNSPSMTTKQRGSRVFVVLLLISALVISACAPRAGSEAGSSGGSLYINLPAIVVEYNESGEASLFDTPVSELGELLGSDLSALSFEADTVQSLVDTGVQHIQIDNQPGGLRFFQNNQPLPSLVWDDTAREGLAQVITAMAEDAGPIAPLLPLLPDIGLGLTLKMPTSGQEIPLEIPGDTLLDAARAAEILSTVRSTQPTQVLEISYSEDGTFETGQIPFMLQFAPIPWEQLELPADTMASITDQGIESLSITLLADGLYIKVNGQDMPFVRWNDQSEFTNLLGLLPVVLGPDSGIEGVVGMVPLLLGIASGLNISLSFPAAG